jgi:hypothetical protein
MMTAARRLRAVSAPFTVKANAKLRAVRWQQRDRATQDSTHSTRALLLSSPRRHRE